MSNAKIREQVKKQTKRQPDPKPVYGTPAYLKKIQDAARKQNKRKRKGE